jgi:hypothetical protein
MSANRTAMPRTPLTTPMATFLASLMAWSFCAFFHSFFLGFAQAGTAIPVLPLSPNATSDYRNWIS